MGILLKPEVERRIELLVESGRFHSFDEVIEKSLDLLESQNRAAPAETISAPVKGNSRPIWEVIQEISRSIPEEDLASLPRDLSINLDHYLYGAPKASE